MSNHSSENMPVWTLATGDDPTMPTVPVADTLTQEHLAELRSALDTFSSEPFGHSGSPPPA